MPEDMFSNGVANFMCIDPDKVIIEVMGWVISFIFAAKHLMA